MSFKKTYTEQIRARYLSSSKSDKAKILDEYCDICEFTRKHAIRKLHHTSSTEQSNPKPGPVVKYPPELLTEPLGHIWLMSGKPCSKYLNGIIRDWISPYQAAYGTLSSKVIHLLVTMSSATMDRLLSTSQFKTFRKGLKSQDILRQILLPCVEIVFMVSLSGA